MSEDDYIKLPRLHVDHELAGSGFVPFPPAQVHYLRNVLRRQAGDRLRLFNGRDGEWLAALESVSKKDIRAVPEKRLRPQPPAPCALHLVFAPIKKARLDFMVEKAVELGATHLHPVLTRHTEVRHINADRLLQQIIEAAEQCERLDVPCLTPLAPLDALLGAWPDDVPMLACLERRGGAALLDTSVSGGSCAVLIGPEGGFTAEEAAGLERQRGIIPVSLGPRILRSETAALYALSVIQSRTQTL